MNRVFQPRPLVVLGLNVWMGTAAGADELVEIPTEQCLSWRVAYHGPAFTGPIMALRALREILD